MGTQVRCQCGTVLPGERQVWDTRCRRHLRVQADHDQGPRRGGCRGCHWNRLRTGRVPLNRPGWCSDRDPLTGTGRIPSPWSGIKIIMEENKNLQHVQVPNGMGHNNLEPKDQLIYMVIKSHDNPNQECWPSLQILSKESGASINTIRDSIKRLKNAGYIKTELVGRKTRYTFDPYKKFEPFSPEFIKNKNLSFTTKSYLVASQQYMYKDVEGVGKIGLSNRNLSQEINMPESTIRRCNAELVSKDYLTILKNEKKDLQTGCFTDTKIMKLKQLGQAVIWTLCDHEEQIRQNTQDISKLEERLNQQEQLIQRLLNENTELKKAQTKNNIEYKF